MRRYAYRTIEYGGRHSGSVSYTPTSDALAWPFVCAWYLWNEEDDI